MDNGDQNWILVLNCFLMVSLVKKEVSSRVMDNFKCFFTPCAFCLLGFGLQSIN